jgi:hypothetical protein
VLSGAGTSEIVEALVGLPLDAAELRAIVSGCGFGVAAPADGRAFAGGWASVETGDAVTYLREVEGRWRVVGAARPPLAIHYVSLTATRPAAVRLQAAGPTRADLTVRLSDVSINVPLGTEVFEVVVPPSAAPLTLGELRRAGPLGVP